VDPKYKLLTQLMYGSGLRLMEAVRLRVHDIDYDYLSVMVWQGKGNKNRFRPACDCSNSFLMNLCYSPARVGRRHPHSTRAKCSFQPIMTSSAIAKAFRVRLLVEGIVVLCRNEVTMP
ncbi:tyrosine-type recombinase/integrase, partial [Arsukibacterium sp.]|uniref:tyrosine-type recombinase/integrase n=1 Tax=Arsukibacterium sp. TaxID=1977258 RepID=UPI0035644F4F